MVYVMFNETLSKCLAVASSKFKLAIIIVVDTIETHRLFFLFVLENKYRKSWYFRKQLYLKRLFYQQVAVLVINLNKKKNEAIHKLLMASDYDFLLCCLTIFERRRWHADAAARKLQSTSSFPFRRRQSIL